MNGTTRVVVFGVLIVLLIIDSFNGPEDPNLTNY